MEKYARFKYMPCLPLGEDGRRITASDKHTALSRKAAAEGMVLAVRCVTTTALCWVVMLVLRSAASLCRRWTDGIYRQKEW